MIRLLLYTQNHEPGGGNRYFTDFIKAAAVSARVDVLTNRGGLFEHDRKRMHALGIPVGELDVLCVYDLMRCGSDAKRVFFVLAQRLPIVRNIFVRILSRKNRKRFASYLDGKRYDAVIAFNGGYPAAWSCFDLLSVASDRGFRTVMSVVSMPAPRGAVDRVYRQVVSRIDSFIVNCAAIRTALSVSRGIPEWKIDVIYNCTALPDGADTAKGDSRHDLRFGFVGRVEALKGAEMLAVAFSEVLKDTPGIRLDFYGKTMLAPDMVALIDRCDGKMTLHGMFGEPDKEVYPNMDVLILPSFWEGFPYVIIEAMAHGIPVIATDVGGVSEAVLDGRTGLLIPPCDPERLRQAIRLAAAERERLAGYGENARRLVRERFSSEAFLACVRRYLEENLMVRAGAPGSERN